MISCSIKALFDIKKKPVQFHSHEWYIKHNNDAILSIFKKNEHNYDAILPNLIKSEHNNDAILQD